MVLTDIIRSAQDLSDLHTGLDEPRNAEVAQLHVSVREILSEEQVLGFQVQVCHITHVQVRQAFEDLAHGDASVVFREPLLVVQDSL